ncbi:conserved protein of unknown function [Acidithiobacillus ferrivorans]|uniref:KilA-N DNA-binding domain-containing protein n=1 Tax=Acidithiobacillus ferrivorans TaxID=160808 RepID=A0A060UU20_9PROT|nr:ORF6N domain-containing protein [Acidithiobacillus ferrivorans]CDQ10039.1 conserved hypothetical protein [Acidithiobacillus ferrivorans]SMH64718.1 conserved protein of unknown function [Acidithiobacillus ferrivorans]
MVVADQKKENDGNDFRTPVARSKVEIVGQNLQVAEYLGHRVITFAMIDRLHQRPSGTAKKRFNENKSRLVAGDDFYLVDYSQRSVLRTFGIEVPSRGLTLVTMSGYLLLVKLFTDDLAWDIQRRLVSHYFLAKAMGMDGAHGRVLPDIKAVPLLSHEADRVDRAVSIIARASVHYVSEAGKTWETLSKKLDFQPSPPAKNAMDTHERIWMDLCRLSGVDSREQILRGALPRIWALLNHMNRFYSGGQERIGKARQGVDPRNLLAGPPKPVSTLGGITLRQAFSKQTALHLESQLGDIPVSELLGYDRSFLGRLPNIGGKKVAEIESFFAGYGLRLGMLPRIPE